MLGGTWKRWREWVRDWWTAPARCAKAERELKLQRSINTALNAQLKRQLRERDQLFGDIPGLSPAEIERLGMLAGACGAVAKAVEKVIRFGWEGQSPFGGRPNRVALEREVGKVRAVVNLMLDADDLRLSEVQRWQKAKYGAHAKWTLYQECSMSRAAQLAMIESIADKNVN